MLSDKFKILKFLPVILSYGLTTLFNKILAKIHHLTYKPLPPTFTHQRTVVVVGGSFAGVILVRRLMETLPSGWKVVLVEKNSHLNYLFTFPRFSVIKGYEPLSFIPYDKLADHAPTGIFERMQARVIDITSDGVVIENGEVIKYDYLVITTGTSSPLPNKVVSTEKLDGCAELQSMQDKIESARTIAVVGGGAVGVEIASDIKSFNPDKNVTIVHSRDRLLTAFGPRLGDHVLKSFEDLGVEVILNERPVMDAVAGSLVFGHGKEKKFDLIIPCTGQIPNSSIISSLSPTSISKSTSRILVKPTLQVHDSAHPNIFAFGDVAESGGPKMARAAFFQTEVVLKNILSLIKHNRNEVDLRPYIPYRAIEGSIKLTLGKSNYVIYAQEDNGSEMLIPAKNGKIDLDVGKGWKMFSGSSITESGWQPPALNGA